MVFQLMEMVNALAFFFHSSSFIVYHPVNTLIDLKYDN